MQSMSDAANLARPLKTEIFDLSSLNDAQRRAVEAIDGPVLVLAGAGTGKTRVLTTRLAYILATARALPAELLAVTFTNKAAREMRERLEAMIGRRGEGVWLGTFHSIASRILRRHAEAVMRSMTDMGVPATRVGVASTTDPAATVSEVRVFVR